MRGSAGFRLSTIITVLSVLIVILCVATVTVISKTSIEESSDIEKARLNDEQKIAIQDQMLENINEVHAVLRKLTEKSGFSRVVAAGDRSLAYDFLLELFGYDLPNRPDVAYVSRSREGNWLDVSEFAGYKAPEEVYEALGRVSELVEI